MAVQPLLKGGEKKHWWHRNRKVVEKYMKDARSLISTQHPNDVASAVNLLDAVLSLSPHYELALELKARSLLYLRRYKDVADMLQDYIPSLRMAGEDFGELSSTQLSRDKVKLLNESPSHDSLFKCFSVSDLKKMVMTRLGKNYDEQGQWRYLVLGQACCHLGLMEDAMALLQTGKRLATAAFRRESICWSDDSFSLFSAGDSPPSSPSSQPLTEAEKVAHMLSRIKLLLRRRAAALAALNAGLYSESIRHFTKILENRRGVPQAFLAECFMHRASAYSTAGRVAEAIADCNKTLALEPSCLNALETRASLLESIRCFPDSLHDLEHLKLLFNTILRDRKLPGPVWKRHNVRYREIPEKLRALNSKIQQLKQKIANGEIGNVDYYSLMGIRRGCSRSELERAYLLLNLRHKPERSMSFVDRFELTDEDEMVSIKDRAKMSTLLLYRLIQRGYSAVTSNLVAEEAAETQRKAAESQRVTANRCNDAIVTIDNKENVTGTNTNNNDTSVVKGVFCRDLVVVGSLISRAARFSQPVTVKYEALSC